MTGQRLILWESQSRRKGATFVRSFSILLFQFATAYIQLIYQNSSILVFITMKCLRDTLKDECECYLTAYQTSTKN